ncbi:MAG: acetyl-CoA carboxylase biotin carboxyl carrier protein subunit [Aquabacterium sp.]
MAHHAIKSQVTGTVWKIERQPGDAVQAGDTVLILESMKMEIPAESPVAGVVHQLQVTEGQNVTEGDVVAMIAASP